MKKHMVENGTSPKNPEVNVSSSTSPDYSEISLTKLEEEILSLLQGQSLYGLQISQAFEEISEGRRTLSIGTLYPTLSRLEEKGLVTSRMEERPNDDKGGARRKYFKITRLGSRVLVETQRFREQLSEWQPV